MVTSLLPARVLLLLLGGLLAACGPAPETLTLVEPEVRLLREPGQSVRLECVAHDAQGRLVPEPRLSWSSSAPEIARVEQGVVTALRTGRATIEVSSGKARASMSFVVSIPGRLAAQVGDGDFIEVGRKERLIATVVDELGKRIREAVPEWRSDDEEIARIDGEKVLGVAPGETTLTVTYGRVTQRVPVRVVPALSRVSIEPAVHTFSKRGQELALRAVVRDSRGKIVEGVPVRWFTSNASVVRVSSSGRVTAVGPGRALVSISVGRKVAAAEFTVP
jgi:hypothetical protein